MNILFTGDILRHGSDNNPGEQSNNIRWLADFLSPSLGGCSRDIRIVTHGEGAFDGSGWLRALGVPGTQSGWIQSLAIQDWTPVIDRMDTVLGNADLVIGFEMPAQFKEHIRFRGRAFLDVAVSPYRCCDDICLMVQASDESMRQRLMAGVLDKDMMRRDVAPFVARIRRETSESLSADSLTVIGQSEVDRSLRVGGRVVGWADFEDEVFAATRGVEFIYFKPHPYANPAATERNLQFFSRFAKVVELKEHTYVTLARRELNRFITLSSSVAFEAELFGKKIHNLASLPYEVISGSEVGAEAYVNLGASVTDSCFWAHVLLGASPSHIAPAWPLPSNRLRDSLGPWWSFESMDRQQRLASRVLGEPIRQLESRHQQLTNEMNLFQMGTSAALDKLAALPGMLAEKDRALAAKDAAIAAKDVALNEVNQSLETQMQHIRHLEQHLHLHKVEINRLRHSLYGASWHTHLYRGWKRFVGDKQYNERANHSPKRYSNLQVPWHTHLYRAGVGLFVKGERPWHTHLFRSWQSLRGDKRYAPRATTVTCVDSAPQADDAASPAKRFARYRDEAGI